MLPVLFYLFYVLSGVSNEVLYGSESLLQDLKQTHGNCKGNTSSIESHPYAVVISVLEDYVGAGAIVDSRWILTTASSIYLHPVSKIKLRGGSSFSNKAGQLLEAEKIVIHEEYDGKFNYNFALIKTRNQIKFGEKTKIVELATHTPLPGTQVELCGWGTVSIFDDTRSAHRIKEGRMEVLDLPQCKETLWNYDVTEQNLCTASNTLATCRFGGGDLLLYDKKLVGLHLGNPSCSTENPTVFANIPVMKNWIENRIKNDS